MSESEHIRRSRVIACDCGATVVGYVDGDRCPVCEEVILDAAR